MLKTFVLGLLVSLSFLAANTPDKATDKAQSLPEGTKKVKVVLVTEGSINTIKQYYQLLELVHADSYLVNANSYLDNVDIHTSLEVFDDINDFNVVVIDYPSEHLVPIGCLSKSDWLDKQDGWMKREYSALDFSAEVFNSDSLVLSFLEKYGKCIAEKDTATAEYIKGLTYYYSNFSDVLVGLDEKTLEYLYFEDDKTREKYSSLKVLGEPIAKVTYPIRTSISDESVTLPVYEYVVVSRAEILKRLYEVVKYSVENSSEE